MSEVPDTGRVVADRYRLLDPLGEGAASIVWRARDEVLGREVAVKEVRTPAALPASDAQRLHSRLEREAWAVARVSHRNVVAVHDVVTEDSRPWIVMELIRGLALSDVLDADGTLPPRRAARIGAEVLTALRGGHGAGLLHRDVKPGNVLMANDGRVMLKDFGFTTPEGSCALTVSGEAIGSPEYLAPERALGRTPGPESDLWSLGVLLYTATEGQSPFGRRTPADTLRAVTEEEMPPLRRAGALTPVVEGLLRKDPAERLTAGEAERRLRILAAGGTGAALGGPAGPQLKPPTDDTGVTAGEAGTGEATAGEATAGEATAATGPPEPVGRTKRTGVLVALGAILALLIAGGLAWALSDDDGTDRGGGGKASSGTSAGAPAAGPAEAPPGATGRRPVDGVEPA
ncbi:serine/threonine-protein kinase [Streptomyces atroolivaceus]|uniref:serine/threonine-protein kinase n=1 Tax=Streptomyces atroolivaceus TaxID=66869 RepID=UPI00379B5ADB